MRNREAMGNNKLDRAIVTEYLENLDSKYRLIHRSNLARKIVRKWARSAKYSVAIKGPIPESVFMDWVEVHMSDTIFAINATFTKRDGVLYRHVRAHCCLCGDIHIFTVRAGSRGNLGFQVASCVEPYNVAVIDHGLELRDNTPMSAWEAKNS